MNNLSKGYSIAILISITILFLSFSPESIAGNLKNIKSPDVLNVQTESRCIPAEECVAYNIILNATVEACANPSSLNWQYLVKNYETDDIIQYSYNYLPVPAYGIKGDNNLDDLDHTMNARLTVLDTLPVGEYYVEWTVYDSLRNPYTGTQFFKIFDTEPPVSDIFNIKDINTADPIYAISFDKGYESNSLASFDNCKASDELYFTFSPVLPKLEDNPDKWVVQYDKYGYNYYDLHTGHISTKSAYYSGMAYGWNPDLKSSFTLKSSICDKIHNGDSNNNSPYYLKIYVWDDFNDSNDCNWNSYSMDSVLLNIDCGEPDLLTRGKVFTLDDNPVENMTITVDDGEQKENTFTDSNGYYQIYGFYNSPFDFNISASKSTEYKKGISTLDVLLIRRFILGLMEFDSPYKAIAADVNGDNKISANDIIQLVHLLIGKKEDFNNVSYLGIFKDYDFKNPNMAYKESLSASKKSCYKTYEIPLDIDFWAIKIGDVNLSSLDINGRDYPKISLFIEDTGISTEDGIKKIPVYIDNVDYLQGFQLAFEMQGLEVLDIESDKLDISKDNYNIKDGKLIMSMDVGIKGLFNFEPKEPLFVLYVKSSDSGKLSEMISLDNTTLKGEIYQGKDLKINNLSLEFRNSKNKFELFQNYPNPFTDQTTISFNLSEDKIFKLEIYDLKGKIVKTFSGLGKKGLNKVRLANIIMSNIKTDKDINKSGIYIYRLIAGEDIAIKKMVKINFK